MIQPEKSKQVFWRWLLCLAPVFTLLGCASTPKPDVVIDFQGSFGNVVVLSEGARSPVTLDGDEIVMDQFTVPLPLLVAFGEPGTILLFTDGQLQQLGRIPLEVDEIEALHYTAGWRVSPAQLALVLGPGAILDRELDRSALIDVTLHVSKMRWHPIPGVHAHLMEMAGVNAPDSGEVLFISEMINSSRIQFHLPDTMSEYIDLKGADVLAGHLIDSIQWDDPQKTVLTREFHNFVPILYKMICFDNTKGCPESIEAGLLAGR